MGHITKNLLRIFLLKIHYPLKILQNHILKFFMYFSYSYSCTNVMAGFHIPGDLYFPKQGNVGQIEEDPEEMIEEDPEEDSHEEEDREEDQEDTDSEPQVYNPHPVPAPRRNFQGPTPR